MTRAKQELEILQELEKILPPTFYLFPEVTHFDANFKEISNISSPKLPEGTMVSFSNQEHNEYLKNHLQYQTKDGIHYFSFKEARKLLNNLPQKSFI